MWRLLGGKINYPTFPGGCHYRCVYIPFMRLLHVRYFGCCQLCLLSLWLSDLLRIVSFGPTAVRAKKTRPACKVRYHISHLWACLLLLWRWNDGSAGKWFLFRSPSCFSVSVQRFVCNGQREEKFFRQDPFRIAIGDIPDNNRRYFRNIRTF